MTKGTVHCNARRRDRRPAGQRRHAERHHAVRLLPGRPAVGLQPAVGDRRHRPDRGHRRRLRRPVGRGRPGRLPRPVRSAGLHHGQRLLPQGEPDRRHDATRRKNGGWAEEISLDLDMVSAICPNCHILLVEANVARPRPTSARRSTRRRRWARPRSATATAAATRPTPRLRTTTTPASRSPPAPATAAYGVEFPASSHYVTAVGGTYADHARATPWLDRDRLVRRGQRLLHAEHRADRRRRPSAPAARSGPSPTCPRSPTRTPASRSTTASPTRVTSAGSSSAAPASPRRSSPASTRWPATRASIDNNYPYTHTRRPLLDVTSGSNGTCSPTQLCTARVGWDGPTGLGTPNGVGALLVRHDSSLVAATEISARGLIRSRGFSQ